MVTHHPLDGKWQWQSMNWSDKQQFLSPWCIIKNALLCITWWHFQWWGQMTTTATYLQFSFRFILSHIFFLCLPVWQDLFIFDIICIVLQKSEPGPLKKWWLSLKDSEKVFYPLLAANVLVFGAWRVKSMQPIMIKYFCSNPASSKYYLYHK